MFMVFILRKYAEWDKSLGYCMHNVSALIGLHRASDINAANAMMLRRMGKDLDGNFI
jgi:hypothetical protein